jgi:hypothetical protein
MSVSAASDAVPATEVFEEARAVGASQRGRLRTPVDLEVVIPAYTESARLSETLRQSVAHLDQRPWRTRLCDDADLAAAMGTEGRRFAAGYDWDALAARQAEVYRAAAVELVVR